MLKRIEEELRMSVTGPVHFVEKRRSLKESLMVNQRKEVTVTVPVSMRTMRTSPDQKVLVSRRSVPFLIQKVQIVVHKTKTSGKKTW